MKTPLIIIDPLRLKLRALLRSGERNVLSVATNRYGTEPDISEFSLALSSIPKKTLVFIDFTPFASIGRHEAALSAVIDKCPSAILLVSHPDMRQLIYTSPNIKRLSVISFFPNGTISEFRKFGRKYSRDKFPRRLFSELFSPELGLNSNINAKYQEKLSDIEILRSIHSQSKLLSLLHKCASIVHTSDAPDNSQKRGPRSYLVMPNGMLVSAYLDLKTIAHDPDSLLAFAYECIVAICRCFRRDRDWLGEVFGIAVPNNTALLLASCVSIITSKPLIAIDRLGPIPAIPHQRAELTKTISGKELLLFEEVIATGNEVDRSILYLDACGATITRVICGYNIDAGRPLLLDKGLQSLCYPSADLKYEYRSSRQV